MGYNIFISYRRRGSGFGVAGELQQRFEKLGYEVFLDVDKIHAGEFPRQIEDAIKGSEDFILILSPGALDRCKDPNDWVRKEISLAEKCGKNILCLSLPDYQMPNPNEMPEDLKSLPQHQTFEWSHVYRDASFKRLVINLRSTPAQVPTQVENQFILKINSDADCIIKKEDEEIGRAEAGKFFKVELCRGTHYFSFENAACSADRIEEIYKVEELGGQDVLFIKLKEIIDKRLKEEKRLAKEAEKKRLAEEAEKKRLEEETERNRLAAIEAEKKRLAKEATKKRLAEEAERKRIADEAEKKRLAEEAEKKRLAAIEAKKKRIVEKVKEMVMVAVEGGTFWMGAHNKKNGFIIKKPDLSIPNYDKDAMYDESPVHQVTLSNYSIGKYPVTQELWKAVMGSNPSYFKGDNLPVESVSWNDVQQFITTLNQLTGKNFRLPTEAEWEYASRGGNKSNGYKYSGSNSIDKVAWYDGNSSDETHPVGTKQPNELGIYDMSGNVWEWCQDWYGSYSSGSQTNPTGPSSGSPRVLRGGGWFNDARNCRVSHRISSTPGSRGSGNGFRLGLVQ